MTGPAAGGILPRAGPGPCSRGAWCAWRTTRYQDGRHVVEAAPADGAFCRRDEDLIGKRLADLPRLYLWLGDELGRLRAAPIGIIGGAAEVPLPLDLTVDMLMRDMADRLLSWHERVAPAACTSDPEARHPGCYVPDSAAQVTEACRVLSRQLERLLALPLEVMSRRMTIAAAADLSTDADYGPWMSGFVHPASDYADVTVPLGGADAGNEITGLHMGARRILGETKARPDELTGIRCKACDRLALYRADQASAGRSDSGYYSACGYCGHRMRADEYRLWVDQWARYERARLKAAPVLENLPGVA